MENEEEIAEYEDPIAYVLLILLSVLVVWSAFPLVFRKINHVIDQRRKSAAAWSKKVDLIVASNRMESYKAEHYCLICYSLATRLCSKCGAVAYCSEKCGKEHWKQGHREECRLMEDIEEINKEAKGQENDDSFISLGLRNRKEFMSEACCAYCAAELWFWSELDIFNFQGYEKDRRIRYLEDECHCRRQFVVDAKEIANEVSEFEAFPLNHEDLSESDEQEICTTAWSKELPQLVALTFPENSGVDCYSTSKVCCNKCQVVFYCSEHSERYEWINGQKQEDKPVDDVEESTKEASKFEHFISQIAPTLGAIATDDQSPRRVTTPNPATKHDHAIRNKYPNLERSSSLSSTNSSCGSCSMDASVSDTISSLHGFD